ncbi:MAG: type VI secretion system contractile sheath small subunit [Planctomycetes bacterium]|jgi:type VI secretion system protein ImpB|nr:type VI secretion system contractile sheath small subunit [Planctomycetota bacterium]MCL4731598.1 type VI secretion system contractile sheath small subunit [Planctomycetota bacterium]
MAKDDGSVAPRERVNIVYKPATGGASEEKELPLKLLVMGDFTNRADDTPLEQRKAVNIDKDNFNDVMKNHKVSIDINVKNTLSGKGDDLSAKLNFQTLKDFDPDAVARQVPELAKMLELREALAALKGPLGNFPAFRKKIEEIIKDPAAREKIFKEVAGGEEGK